MTPSTERFAAAAHAARLSIPGREAFARFAHLASYESLVGFLRDQVGKTDPVPAPRAFWR